MRRGPDRRPELGEISMCRTISLARRIARRTEGQAKPEYAVVLTMAASSCAYLFSELGNRTPSIVSAVAALFS